MSENLIKKEILEGLDTKDSVKQEKIAEFKGNINKFNELNSKLSKLNLIAGRGYRENGEGKNDLKKVLNFVLDKKGLGGSNDNKSRAYFDLSDGNIVLVLNTLVDGKINSSLDKLSKIEEVLKGIDEVIIARNKIIKHKKLLNNIKENINSQNENYKNDSSLVSGMFDYISIAFSGEEKISGIYKESFEKKRE